jgi:NTP pyrophosphatase (non-canonical NTP hydrolase)
MFFGFLIGAFSWNTPYRSKMRARVVQRAHACARTCTRDQPNPSGTERPPIRNSPIIAFGKSISIFDHKIFQLLKPPTMTDSQEIIKALLQFRNERDWGQFHNPKDLALAITIESAELLELFLWKKAEEADVEKVKEELADVFAYAFLIAEKYNLDVKEIVLEKIKKNAEKYPVDKAKGIAKKYNEL